MLILTRKETQSIIIGDNIVIHVLHTRNGQTRIGVTAPRELSVHRQEVYERIHGKLPAILENIQDEEEAI